MASPAKTQTKLGAAQRSANLLLALERSPVPVRQLRATVGALQATVERQIPHVLAECHASVLEGGRRELATSTQRHLADTLPGLVSGTLAAVPSPIRGIPVPSVDLGHAAIRQAQEILAQAAAASAQYQATIVASLRSPGIAQHLAAIEAQNQDLLDRHPFLRDFVVLIDADSSPEEREVAADQVIDVWLQHPLHPARWRLARPKLIQRAQLHGTSVRTEVRRATQAALILAIAEIPDDAALPDLLRNCRAKVANQLSDDIIGPGWRRNEAVLTDEVGLPPHPQNIEFEFEITAELARVFSVMRSLPQREEAALRAKIEGRSMSNADYQALHRARKSIRRRSL